MPVALAVAVVVAAAALLIGVAVIMNKFPHPPLENVVRTSAFGPRGAIKSGGRTIPAHFHAGVDLRAAVGTPFFAVADGTVELIELAGAGVGTILHLRLADDPILGTLRRARVKYAHLESVAVARGDAVKAGQLLGTTGDANGTLDPHLHLELKLFGAAGATDPAPWL